MILVAILMMLNTVAESTWILFPKQHELKGFLCCPRETGEGLRGGKTVVHVSNLKSAFWLVVGSFWLVWARIGSLFIECL